MNKKLIAILGILLMLLLAASIAGFSTNSEQKIQINESKIPNADIIGSAESQDPVSLEYAKRSMEK